jgi:hypothetical protein
VDCLFLKSHGFVAEYRTSVPARTRISGSALRDHHLPNSVGIGLRCEGEQPSEKEQDLKGKTHEVEVARRRGPDIFFTLSSFSGCNA